jgi:hypothetical protein
VVLPTSWACDIVCHKVSAWMGLEAASKIDAHWIPLAEGQLVVSEPSPVSPRH